MTTDKTLRKQTPIARGFFDYFPDAIAAIANVSFVANEQHNPGQPVHWDRSKSTDHGDALLRHFIERGRIDSDGLRHSAKVAWRALALLQEELEAAADSQASPLSLDDLRRPVEDYGAESEEADNTPLPTPEEISQTIDEQAIAAAAAQMEKLGLLDKRDDHTGGCACGKHQREQAAREQKEHPPVPENIPNPPSDVNVIHVRAYAIKRQTLTPDLTSYNTAADGYLFTIEEEVYRVSPASVPAVKGEQPSITRDSDLHADVLTENAQDIYQRIDFPVWGYAVVEPFLRKRAEEIVNERSI